MIGPHNYGLTCQTTEILVARHFSLTLAAKDRSMFHPYVKVTLLVPLHQSKKDTDKNYGQTKIGHFNWHTNMGASMYGC